MDIGNLRRWIRLKVKTIDVAREACLSQGDVHHRNDEREEAEQFHAAAKDIRDARYDRGEPVNDKSVRATDKGHIQIVKPGTLSQSVQFSDRTLSIIGFGLAVAALVVATMEAWNHSKDVDSVKSSTTREIDFLRAHVNEQQSTTRTEVDFLRRHVEEYRIRTENVENTLIISGLSKPRDMMNGPGANPDRLNKEH